VGKGWYSLAEARQDTYEFSKLKRLLVRRLPTPTWVVPPLGCAVDCCCTQTQ
jgi:hypothetical protein